MPLLARAAYGSDETDQEDTAEGSLNPMLGCAGYDRTTLSDGSIMANNTARSRVADAVRILDARTVDRLLGLAEARFVAIEVNDSTIDVESDGQFVGRVNVLLSVPFNGFDGKRAEGGASVSVPAFVRGLIGKTGVEVQGLTPRLLSPIY